MEILGADSGPSWLTSDGQIDVEKLLDNLVPMAALCMARMSGEDSFPITIEGFKFQVMKIDGHVVLVPPKEFLELIENMKGAE